jgi:hypothetical protein
MVAGEWLSKKRRHRSRTVVADVTAARPFQRPCSNHGGFTSVKDRNAKIRTFIDGWNDRSHPFVWTKTAEQILKKANRPTPSNPRHQESERTPAKKVLNHFLRLSTNPCG